MVTTHRLFAAIVGAWLGLTTVGTSSQILPPTAPGERMLTTALQETLMRVAFDRHVQDYAALHRRLSADLPSIEDCQDLEIARAVMDVLATRIRAARADARPGEIFTPDVVPLFQKYVTLKVPPELAAAIIADQGKEEGRQIPTLTVNMTWPEGVTPGFMPARLLLALPPLPAELQYRLLGRALVVWDDEADLVVDFLPGALTT